MTPPILLIASGGTCVVSLAIAVAGMLYGKEPLFILGWLFAFIFSLAFTFKP